MGYTAILNKYNSQETKMTRSKTIQIKDLGKERILFISDLHAPYEHKDALDFLKALKKSIKPTKVICVGDMLDFQSVSYHEHDADLMGPAAELKAGQDFVAKLGKIFPKMVITVGNHDCLPARKLKSAGLPLEMIKSYSDIYQAPKGWEFVDSLTIEVGDKYTPDVFVSHGLAKNVLNVAMQRGQCIFQGHFHQSFEIGYAGNPGSLLFGVNTGCLIDSKSPAFSYNKTQKNRPVIGTASLVGGVPQLHPLKKKRDGSWTGKL